MVGDAGARRVVERAQGETRWQGAVAPLRALARLALARRALDEEGSAALRVVAHVRATAVCLAAESAVRGLPAVARPAAFVSGRLTVEITSRCRAARIRGRSNAEQACLAVS